MLGRRSRPRKTSFLLSSRLNSSPKDKRPWSRIWLSAADAVSQRSLNLPLGALATSEMTPFAHFLSGAHARSFVNSGTHASSRISFDLVGEKYSSANGHSWV